MKLTGAAVLAAIALFMLAGFLNADLDASTGTTVAALLLAVGVPGVGAFFLVRSHFAEKDRLGGRRAELKRKTVEAEILRLSGERGGRLTVVETATALALSMEDAKSALDELALRSHADMQVTDDGVIVYSFYDVRHLDGKSSARGVLDA